MHGFMRGRVLVLVLILTVFWASWVRIWGPERCEVVGLMRIDSIGLWLRVRRSGCQSYSVSVGTRD